MSKSIFVLCGCFGAAAAFITFLLLHAAADHIALPLSIACGLLCFGMLLLVFQVSAQRAEKRISALIQQHHLSVWHRFNGNLNAPGGVFFCTICFTDEGICFLIERRGQYITEFLPKEIISRYLMDETRTELAIDTTDGRRYVINAAEIKELFPQLQAHGWVR